MAGIVTVLLFLFGTAVGVVSIVAVVAIIQKAGYSGWWILTQFVPPIVGWVVALLVVKLALSSGTPSVDKLFGADLIAVVIMFASYLVSWGFFVAFAFGEWPALQANRGGYRPHRPEPGTFGPSGPGPVIGAPSAVVAPPPRPQSPPPQGGAEGQAPGWHRSGPVGAGEQSYWDGSAWTARRRWQNNAWVDLTAPVQTGVGEGGVGPAPST